MTPAQGRQMWELIHENQPRNILELGFLHGVSTCYIAAALRSIGQGMVTAVDLESVRHANPSADQLLSELDLVRFAEVIYEPRSYLWFMMELLKRHSDPVFDMCYIDGAHDWYTDGFAFLLVDRLLKPGGVVVFDDIDWTFGRSKFYAGSEALAKMPEHEIHTPQVRMIIELLVKRTSTYTQLEEQNGLAIVRKSLVL
jgi:predicted O-methyltransferase YrrM